MPTEILTSRTCKISLREDGLIKYDYFQNSHDTLEDARTHLKAIASIHPPKRRSFLIDIRPCAGIDREARAYYSSEEAARYATAIALLVESPVTQVMANFFIGFNRPPVPTRLFTSEAEALAWLKGFSE